MFSVNNEEEAKALLTLACPTALNGEYIAPELTEVQSLDNLQAFSDRLESIYNRFIRSPDVQPE